MFNGTHIRVSTYSLQEEKHLSFRKRSDNQFISVTSPDSIVEMATEVECGTVSPGFDVNYFFVYGQSHSDGVFRTRAGAL